ncbi:MAG: amidophosphoribosyltransferase [Methermicoccaceae archaeon]
MQDACGIVGISLKPDSPNRVAPLLYYALYSLQHRGQESAGISVCSDSSRGELITKRGMGLVNEVFNQINLPNLKGKTGIGHVRYSTSGESDILNAQPFVVRSDVARLAIAHNGNLVNANNLKKELQREGYVFISTSDTEVIAYLLAREMRKNDIIDAFRALMSLLKGSYSLTLLVNNTLYAMRDPSGVKPLSIGKLEDGYVIASESCAIDALGGTLVRDVEPGEVVVLEGGEIYTEKLLKNPPTAHCVFEYIYFARPDSVIDGKLVYSVRMRIGELLWEEYPVDADVVSPVPDSGITFAVGYARRSGLEYLEGLMKNRYVGRTFIMPAQQEREVGVKLKMNAICSNIRNKRVVLVDDSIVRGTTSRLIVDMVRACAPEAVHMRIGSPPIISPCYLGIDMPTREELVASTKPVSEIAQTIGADSLGYLSPDGLVEAIGLKEDKLCMGCLTGVYPVDIPGEKCKGVQAELSKYIKKT